MLSTIKKVAKSIFAKTPNENEKLAHQLISQLTNSTTEGHITWVKAGDTYHTIFNEKGVKLLIDDDSPPNCSSLFVSDMMVFREIGYKSLHGLTRHIEKQRLDRCNEVLVDILTT